MEVAVRQSCLSRSEKDIACLGAGPNICNIFFFVKQKIFFFFRFPVNLCFVSHNFEETKFYVLPNLASEVFCFQFTVRVILLLKKKMNSYYVYLTFVSTKLCALKISKFHKKWIFASKCFMTKYNDIKEKILFRNMKFCCLYTYIRV